MRSLLLPTIVVLACAAVAVSSKTAPNATWLSAPFSPFYENGTVNIDVISDQAAYHASVGVNYVWVCGSEGQFVNLNVLERKKISKAWIEEGHKHGLYIIIHVGSNILEDAKELAKYAENNGADAIAAIPPFYDQAPSLETLAAWLSSIAASAPHTDFFYYHIPGETNVPFSGYDILNATVAVVPTFKGMKYVDEDISDFSACVNYNNGSYQILWAVEPKLQADPFGESPSGFRGFVLAPAYYQPYMSAVWSNYAIGDEEAAYEAQNVVTDFMNLMGGFGGDNPAGRALFGFIGIDLGPPRPPLLPLASSDMNQLEAALQAFGFFNSSAGA